MKTRGGAILSKLRFDEVSLVASYLDADVQSWNPPGQGTSAREDYPPHAFLDKKGRRYPYKYENSEGEWVVSYKGLMAARSRAAQQGDASIFEKATRKLNPLRAERGEEPLSMNMDGGGDFLNSQVIMEICKNLADEAKAVSDYTQSISFTENETTKAMFTEIRNDELGHAQKLIIALTEVLGGSPPEVAARMDAKIKGDRVISIDCWDKEGSLQELLEYIKSNASGGHSFSIVVDPGDPEREKTFGIDGDGTDQIYAIDVELENDGGDSK